MSIESYWEVIEPLFDAVDFGRGMKEFTASIESIPRSAAILFSAHMCLAEVHNGGFLQLFWNSAGMLVPEGVEGFAAIGMPATANLLRQAAHVLGEPYPRERDNRWDALLVASGLHSRELERIFKNSENLYLGFAQATQTLPFDEIEEEFWKTVETESGGFQEAATRYALDTSQTAK